MSSWIVPVLCWGLLAAVSASMGPSIGSVSITGNPPLDDKDLLAGTGLEPGASVYGLSRVLVGNGVVANLRNHGYLDAEAEVSWPEWGSTDYAVGIHVVPGRRSLLGGVEITGAEAMSTEQIRGLLLLSAGEPLTPADTLGFRRAIRAAYNLRGRIRAEVRIDLGEFDYPGDDSIPGTRTLYCTINEGQRFVLGDVRVTGLETVREVVVTREIGLLPGDSLNTDIMRESLARIYTLRLFNDVRYRYHARDNGPVMDVEVVVSERPYHTIDLATGYISPTALFWGAYWKHPNIWGNNQRLTIGSTWTHYFASGQEGDLVEPSLAYEEPWFLSTRWSSKILGSYTYLERSFQEERSYGLGVSFSRLLAPDLRFTFGYGIDRIRFQTTSEDTVITQDWTTTGSLRASVVNDTRSPVLDPARGRWLMLGGKVSGGILGGLDYYRAESESRIFMPLGDNVVLAARGAVGTVQGYNGQVSVPPTDRFYLGGVGTIRGYSYNALGPWDDDGNPLGGNTMLLGNIEARIRVWKFLGIAAFLDSGGIWNDVEDVSTSDAGLGTGLGIRISTPFSPIRFDYGFAPTWRDGFKRGSFYFAIGQIF